MSALPWYRHPWPWLLVAGPACVLVAGAITTWIAFASADGLVAEDYYKQGLAINKRLEREQAALKRGLLANVEISGATIKVFLHGESPAALFVHLAHATRAGHDVRLRLAPVAPGLYQAALPALPRGRWRIGIEDPQGTWRISKEST